MPINAALIQRVRKLALLVVILIGGTVFALTDSIYPNGQTAHEMIEWVGMLLIVICILGRTWTSLYISGRKTSHLVIDGPYSVTRNPLYLFSIIGAAGMGAQAGSIAVALICAALTWIVFYPVVLEEEKQLSELYGKAYRAYVKSVPRLIPRRLWRDEKTLSIHPPKVLATFIDALCFLLAVPFAEACEYLRDSGVLPVLMKLY
ncbi:MAG TPA: isoprenylcysteine carboxylmethyltransferase family protein [Pseudorhodoplanes sp.]|jgi:protein-S-isoprenylcysteine O-methyltransferase Ste14|nr:isoprenylcysteine carboxylmethyltransferase family protein [Pseudorhodoplanes sp.]